MLGGRYSTEKTLETVHNSLSWHAIGSFQESPNLILGGFCSRLHTMRPHINYSKWLQVVSALNNNLTWGLTVVESKFHHEGEGTKTSVVREVYLVYHVISQTSKTNPSIQNPNQLNIDLTLISFVIGVWGTRDGRGKGESQPSVNFDEIMMLSDIQLMLSDTILM